jgi:bacterioferritin-associated ferredoxin
VTDSDIRHAVDEGVRNMKQLKMKTGCASGCGKCIDSAKEVLNQARLEKRQFLSIVSNSGVA